MIGSPRPLVLGIVLAAATPLAAQVDAPKAAASQEPRREDTPQPFVPLHPRTARQQDRIDVLRLYGAARALEDRRRWTDAIDLLEQALKKDPDSVAIPRRLSRLSFALGRTEQAIGFARKVVEADPATPRPSACWWPTTAAGRTRPPPRPCSAPRWPTRRWTRRRRPPWRSGTTSGCSWPSRTRSIRRPTCWPSWSRPSTRRRPTGSRPAEQKLILGNDEAESYRKYGVVFLAAKRYDLAAKAFRRGLIYDPDDAELPRLLAQALLKAGRPDEALATLEPLLKGRPPGRDAYDVLAQVLTALGRAGQIIPRLEEAARADPKNTALRYALADRYREAGQAAKANAIYKELLASQADPEGIGARSESLLKAKRTEELLKLLDEAMGERTRREAVLPQIEAISTDPSYVDEVLDGGPEDAVGHAAPPGPVRPGRPGPHRHAGQEGRSVDRPGPPDAAARPQPPGLPRALPDPQPQRPL
jgi:tetratricopeptide (TPR) repeat protein